MCFKAERIVRSDVLVVGSGGAGLSAAIEARRYGLEVLLLDKSLVGINSSTRFSGGGFKAALPGVMSTHYTTQYSSPEEQFKKTIIHGEWLNDQRLAEILAYDLPARIVQLQEFGVQHVGDIYHHEPYPHGNAITRPLIDYAEQMGVMTKPRVMVSDLILKDGVVVGCLGVDIALDELILLVAKCTVLACGDAGELFERNDTPATMTGDGFAMAYRCGLDLVNMEFSMFEPFVQAEPGLPMMDRHEAEAEFYGILRNSLGEPFLEKVFPMKGGYDVPFAKRHGIPLTDTRELVARKMAEEVYEGRGDQGAVLWDLRHVPDDKWRADIASKYARESLLRGFDVRNKMIHVFPGAISNLGGVMIGENCETGLRGLYAAGMVTGGVHGASRLGGHGLGDGIVFGPRAGRSAARRARTVEMPDVDFEDVKDEKERLLEIRCRPSSEAGDPKGIKKQVQSTMWKNSGILRNKEGLEAAIETLDQIEEERLPKLFAAGARALRYALEASNMVLVAQMVTRAALMRTECRGPHFRLDYPYRDDKNWLKNIVVSKKNGGMNLETRPVIFYRFPYDPTIPSDFQHPIRR